MKKRREEEARSPQPKKENKGTITEIVPHVEQMGRGPASTSWVRLELDLVLALF